MPWVLLKVVDPSYQIPYSLDLSASFTVNNSGFVPAYVPLYTAYGGIEHAKRDIRDLARFVYKPK